MENFEAEIRMGFLDEAKELLANAEQCFLNLENAHRDPAVIEQIFRLAHNFKGSAGAVGFTDLKDFAHKLESLLLKVKNGEIPVTPKLIGLLLRCNDYLSSTVERLRADTSASCANPALCTEMEGDFTQDLQAEPPASAFPPPNKEPAAQPSIPATKPAADESVRVALEKIDHLLNNVGELSILQTVMDQQRRQAASNLNPLMLKTIGQMSKIIKEVQTVSMSLRMLPVRQTFQKMQRIVRDTSATLGKEVEFRSSGDETELDKTVIEQLGDPLVHMVRNAVDHGLENKEEREKAGKSPVGHISLSAFHRGGQIVIEIRDDGRGLDAEKLRKKAREKGLLAANAELSDEEAYHLVFAPGFSTKEAVTDVSGRGVGMDVVKTNISALRGEVEIETDLGKGTCFRVLLPLTLAIIDGMVVSVGGERYVVPINQVHETLQPKESDLGTIQNSGEVLLLRGKSLPLYRLDRLLKRGAKGNGKASEAIALICADNSLPPFAMLVDSILCQQQVVIKSLGEEVTGLPGISGAAILGDGKASLILDLFEVTSSLRKKSKNAIPKGAIA
ncbi:MAG TPA: chemotaxis protein CheA [Bdellovibrionota bacterium]|jgi:two-component system chemotaxis sensor kinase CheA